MRIQLRSALVILALTTLCLGGCRPAEVPLATSIPTQATEPPAATATPTVPLPTITPTPATLEPTATVLPTRTPWVYATPPALPVQSFELGGHIKTWRYTDYMKYAGMTWVKQQIHYPHDGREIIDKAHALGFKVQLTGLGSTELTTQPDFIPSYSAWVADLAAAGADAIEVWNEPNIDREWALGHISASAYTALLCDAYEAIKGANPETFVISAAPAPTGYFGGCGPNGCDDIPFLEGMIAAGASACLDYVGAHYAAGATPPSVREGHPAAPSSRHHSWYFLPQTELYYELFDRQYQLFYTEMGYASQEGVPRFAEMFAWARETTNAQQAEWLAEAVELSIETGMVRAIMVWNVDFTRYGYDPQDGYAIVRDNGYCPACEALHAVFYSDD